MTGATTEIAVVVLAAGGSTRLGRPKQLLVYKRTTLIRRAVDAALGSGARSVLVVVGSSAEAVRAELANLSVRFVQNDEWEKGMGSSIACAIRALPTANAALFLACDQPAVSAEHLSEMLRLYRADHPAIVASMYKGTAGVPALFAAELFSELLELNPAGGAKPVITRDPRRVMTVPLVGGEIDVDTEADYDGLIRR